MQDKVSIVTVYCEKAYIEQSCGKLFLGHVPYSSIQL